MDTVRIQLGECGYDVAVTTDDRDGFGPFARQRARGDQAVLVTDENVLTHANWAGAALSAAGFRTTVVVLPAGESQKSLASASRLYDRLADLHADRETLVVPLGGGVVGDLAGF